MTQNTQITTTDVWINQRTGEIITTNTIKKEINNNVDIGFEKIWIGHILEAIEEIGNTKMKILFWLIKNKNQNNEIKGTVRDIAEKLGVSKTTVSALMSALRKANIIRLEHGGRWVLNPAVAFKGTHDNRMNVLIRYKTMEQQKLHLNEISEQTETETETETKNERIKA